MAGGARGAWRDTGSLGTPAWSPMSLQNLGGRSSGDVSCPRAKHTFNLLLFSQP